jgi:hypothetical protein
MKLNLKCPESGQSFHVTTEDDVRRLAEKWSDDIGVVCPHCHAKHWFSFREAYVAALLDNVRVSSNSKDERVV